MALVFSYKTQVSLHVPHSLFFPSLIVFCGPGVFVLSFHPSILAFFQFFLYSKRLSYGWFQGLLDFRSCARILLAGDCW